MYNEDSDATEQFAALVHATETVLPPRPKGKRDKHSNNPTVLALRKRINQLAHCCSVSKSKVFRKRLQEAKNEMDQQYKVLQEEYIISQIEETESEFKGSNIAKAW